MNYQVEVRPTPTAGRGVFALTEFLPRDIIEDCPVVNISPEESKKLNRGILASYIFDWLPKGASAIALGYGSLYNHSYAPNARYQFLYPQKILRIVAIAAITPGQEITINYNYYPHSKTPFTMTNLYSGRKITIKP